MTPSRFTIMQPSHRQERAALPADRPLNVPWSLVAPHERQAEWNHSQTLAGLNERGGLSYCELAAVLEDRAWHSMSDLDAIAVVRAHLARIGK